MSGKVTKHKTWWTAFIPMMHMDRGRVTYDYEAETIAGLLALHQGSKPLILVVRTTFRL